MIIPRDLESSLGTALTNMPVVAIVGPRQVGKTTLALQFSQQNFDKESFYLDLELDTDLSKLNDAESYLRRFEN
ncbi:MAG: AAA family ATPase, partial [Balneolaceae bacterium]